MTVYLLSVTLDPVRELCHDVPEVGPLVGILRPELGLLLQQVPGAPERRRHGRVVGDLGPSRQCFRRGDLACRHTSEDSYPLGAGLVWIHSASAGSAMVIAGSGISPFR